VKCECCKPATSSSHSSPEASSEKSMEARTYNFRTDSSKFRKGKIMGAQRSNFPLNFPKMEDYCAKTAQNLPKLWESCAPWQKLHGCAKTRKLRKSCTPQYRNFLVGLVCMSKRPLLYKIKFRLISRIVLRSSSDLETSSDTFFFSCDSPLSKRQIVISGFVYKFW